MDKTIEVRDAMQRETQYRSIFVKREAINVDARTVELAFSSEEPVERWGGAEILDHAPSSVDLARLKNGGAVLVDHDPCDQVGVVEECRIEGDRVGRAVVRFGKSERAEEIFQDVVDGIRKHVSVGYRVHKVEVSDPESDSTTYRVTRWEPLEISIVSIPADASVGVGRSIELTPEPKAAVPPIPEAAPAPVISVRSNTMSIEKTPEQIAAAQAEIAAAEKRGVDLATARVTELVTIGREYAKHGGEELATRAIQEGKDSRWLQNEIMSRMSSAPSLAAPDIGLTEKETRQYSVTRAMGAMIAAAKGERDAWKGAEFERECHDAVAKRNGESQNGGIYVPFEVQKRDMSTAANGGGYLVATNNDASNFIDLLRNRSSVGQMGATFLPGLTGNVTIPKQTGSATGYWLTSESTEITESNQTIGQLALSPKTVGAYTEFSRQLMMQSAPAIDMLIMDDLAKVIALAIDLAALNGNGSGAPVGIVNTAGIGSVTGTSIDYAKALEFQTDVAAANALTSGCGYLTTPAKAAILAQRQKFTSTDTPLWTGNILEGNVCGFNAKTTTQISDGMLFGDFAQLIIASWGVLELAVDPTANFKAGIVGIRAFQTADVGVRQAGAFSWASSIT